MNVTDDGGGGRWRWRWQQTTTVDNGRQRPEKLILALFLCGFVRKGKLMLLWVVMCFSDVLLLKNTILLIIQLW